MNQRHTQIITAYLRMMTIFSAIILTGCHPPSTPTPIPGLTFPFRTNAESYPNSMPPTVIEVYIHIQNNSPNPIILEPLINTRIMRGGLGGVSIATLETNDLTHTMTETVYYQPLRLAPTQAITLDISSIYVDDCYALELYYRDTTNPDIAYVMYSNTFYVEGPFPSKSPCPSGAIEVTHPLELLSSRFELASRATTNKWVIPYCYAFSAREDIDFHSATTMYAFSTLERLTDWGTWEVLHPERDDCQGITLEPVEVSDPQIVDVWGAPGFDWQQLAPGWYRWHIRYYDLLSLEDDRPFVAGNHSWFTDLFYIGE